MTFLKAFIFGTPEVFVGNAATKFDKDTLELTDQGTKDAVKTQLTAFAKFIEPREGGRLARRLRALREELRPQLRMAGHRLRRVGRLRAELFGRVPGPARIPDRRAREADQVRLAGCDDVLGLLVAGDQADRHGGDAAFLLHLLGERHLIAGRQRDLLQRIESPPVETSM